jgi:serine/threonine-protein kinase RIM15
MDIAEPPADPYVSTLHELIAVSTDIIEMSATTLTSRPGMGSDLVRKVQEVGRAWDSHPDWYGRTWYITVLLAVATLARVVEWFEAERQFWNFEEDDEDGEIEPLTFVLKPEFDVESVIDDRSSEMNVPRTPIAHAGSVSTEDENPLGLSREASISGGMKMEVRMSRNQRVPQKDLRGGLLIGDRGTEALGLQNVQDKPLPQTPEQQGQVQTPTQSPEAEVKALQMESNRVQASEHLRQKAEEAKSSNILMELNLDGEHFLYINRTWYDVIG